VLAEDAIKSAIADFRQKRALLKKVEDAVWFFGDNCRGICRLWGNVGHCLFHAIY
jgi:hypothetical protein